MIQPIKFPNQYAVIREEAEKHLRLNSEDRLRITSELMSFGRMMVQQNPDSKRVSQLQMAEEEAWQHAQRHIFAQYEARHAAHH